MDESLNITLPRYQKIALDLARQIGRGRFQDGERISSRTQVASKYNVSPETARRAIAVLADLEIVEATRGSGVVILSRKKAREYIARYSQAHAIGQLQQEVFGLIKTQQMQAVQLERKLHRLLEKTEHFGTGNLLLPVEMPIRKPMNYLGKTISEINFWHNTGATVVAIQREGELMLSPGPYAKLTEGDVLLFIGDQEVYERVHLFLYGKE